jgi:hypothetical protein
VLLLTDKKERSLLYKKLSIDFAARAVFGQAALDDAQGKLAAAFGVNASAQAAAPAAASGAAKASSAGSTLLVSPPGPHVVSADVLKKLPAGAFSWSKYEGQMTYAALYEHLDAHLPRAPVVQLRSQADFNSACGTAPDVTLCFIAVLPHEAEAAALAAGTFPAAEELEHCEAADAACFRRRRRVSGFEDAGDDDEGADRDDDEEDADDEKAVAKWKLQAGARVYRALQKLASRSYIRVDWVSTLAMRALAHRTGVFVEYRVLEELLGILTWGRQLPDCCYSFIVYILQCSALVGLLAICRDLSPPRSYAPSGCLCPSRGSTPRSRASGRRPSRRRRPGWWR